MADMRVIATCDTACDGWRSWCVTTLWPRSTSCAISDIVKLHSAVCLRRRLNGVAADAVVGVEEHE